MLIRIDDDAPAECLQIRWQAALRICGSLLGDRPWQLASLAPQLVQMYYEAVVGVLVGAER